MEKMLIMDSLGAESRVIVSGEKKMKKTTFGVIVGNRGFFPDALAKEGRKNILGTLKNNGFNSVALSMQETKYGTVETFADAKKCAALFAEKSEKIDGIIVTLPNFGDEKAVAETIKRSGLNVPILIHAEPDTQGKMSASNRRDSFCGKISVCNNLRQAAIPYTLTMSHTVKVESAEFKKDLDDFASICRVVNGLKNPRFGAIGARPAAFNTVRYSEKILELYREEIPYSVEVLISEFKEREESKDFISAEIVVERDTQKAIIIGKGGTAIKKLGEIARKAVEDFLQREVFLELRVKVRKNWRSDENLLKQFGYKSEKKNKLK